MSTTPNLSLQVYAQDGTPIPPAVSREHLLDLVRGAYDRAGTHLERGDVDIELAEVADKAACSLLRDRWKDDFPTAAYVELLTAVAALRAMLGFDPSPTAREVLVWADELGERLGSDLDDPKSSEYAKFVDGPYSGAVLIVPGTLAMPDMGPAPTLNLPIAWGDTADPGRGEARYRRDPAARERLWHYRLDDETVREDARPHIALPTAPAQGGRA
ncbi:hypothetical protein QJ054_34100 [Streptomyces sp. AN-3]|uniref:hypothetical protein n=1 Tax=Streptomyces sp. AN-3 TaxID=3044177 RepID=UPI002499C981|nr:hypothetical protein [Streptomyces sp. AN-3]MDI3102071.1 hypothetical protein [Streptomyces sp. AN-3]